MTGERNGGNDRAGPASVGDDALGEGKPAPIDEAAAGLAREVYWAAEGASRLSVDDGSLRERLDAYTHQLRVEQRQLVPENETLLGSASSWKRRLKSSVWRLTRFSTMRYDRLLADLAEMNGELAKRLTEMEEEVARLRDELDHRGGERS